MNKFSILSALFVVSLCLLLGGCKEKKPETPIVPPDATKVEKNDNVASYPNDAVDENQEATKAVDATNLLNEEVSQVSTEPINNELSKIVSAVEKDGYWFRDGRAKPKKIENYSKKITVVEDSEEDFYGRLDYNWDFDKEPIDASPYIWVNKSKKPLIDGINTLNPIVREKRYVADSNGEDVILDPGVFLKSMQDEYTLDSGIQFQNHWWMCKAATFGMFTKENVYIIGLNRENKNEGILERILYVIEIYK
ncbi:MAG: hypothetical protein ACOX3T_01315 [Bdellovibrionota bacterium]